VTWAPARLDDNPGDLAPRDLVILGYVLDELPPAIQPTLIERLWRLTGDTLVIVEPGTTQGWKRILQARDLLIAAGGHVLAPCPHSHACPLVIPDWCHFSARVSRSRLHREAKGGTVPWEDEKFIYLAVSRHPAQNRLPRIIAPERPLKAGVTFTLCEPGGSIAQCQFTKRECEVFQAVRRLRWGDHLPKM
jgi:ribosomal protein RSM22 (predicted rRNA methylase)